MNNDTTFLRMGSGGCKKCRKKAPRSVEFNFLTNRQNALCRTREEGQIYKTVASDFLPFAPGLSYDISKFSDDFTLFFRL